MPNLPELSMSGCSVSGPIDQSLMKLQSLSVIRLDGNDLNASFPEFISKFASLSLLSLRDCGLSGVFPSEIFQVPTLHTLDISENQFLHGALPRFSHNNSLRNVVITDTDFSGRLPISVSKLSALSRLELANCHFNGTLPKSMAELTQLVYLDLSHNNFTGQIPCFSKNLTYINLSQNSLSGGIPSFKMTKDLTQIILFQNDLSGAIPFAQLEGLSNLVLLDLSYNSFSGGIPSSLIALPALLYLLLSNNHFDGKIPEHPNPSTSMLDILDFSHNNLEGPVPDSIFELGILKTLKLSFNKFNDTIPGHKFRGLGELQTLDLSYNNLSFSFGTNDSMVTYLPMLFKLKLVSCNLKAFPHLKDHPNLQYLDLSCNQIYERVPYWIWGLGDGVLMHLNLSFNQLVGIQEPYSVSPFLAFLDLHFNMLQGKLPILPHSAFYIDLSSNYFTSSIPVDIGSYLSETQFLSLSNNGLTGDIPESICNELTDLVVLDLSNNSLSGRIPACIFQMSQQLWILNLQRNNFSNSIPDVFPVDCTFKTLHLNGNSIQGGVPKSLTNCTTLEILDLGNNNMTDNFPSFLMSISTMRVVVLRSNLFHGQIGCLNTNRSTWSMLQMFDIAFNKFSGELPRQCLRKRNSTEESALNHLQFYYPIIAGALLHEDDHSLYYQDTLTTILKGLELELMKMITAFNTMDLSSNNFSGPIPEEFGQLESIYSLNLSNNGFTGKIPASPGKLKEFESLDLSHNHLNGTIPASLANLNFLSFLNLSYNQLVGKIPTGTQLQSIPANSLIGNKGLHGPPLTGSYTNRVPSPSPDPNHLSFGTDHKIEWNIISVEAGFITGSGIVVAPLVSCKRWRRSYFQHAEDIAYRIIPVCLLRKWLSWTKVLENKRRRH